MDVRLLFALLAALVACKAAPEARRVGDPNSPTWLDNLLTKQIEVAGDAMPSRTSLNFVSGATLSDNPTNNSTDVIVTAGLDGGSGASLPDGGFGAIWYEGDAGVTVLPIGSAGQVLTVDGGRPGWLTPTTAVAGVLYGLTGNPATDVNATTAETALFSYTLPANTLPTNGLIRISALTSAFNNSGGSVTQTYRLHFGTNAYLTWTATNGSSNSHDVVQTFDISLVAAGATNAQYLQGTTMANVGTASGGAVLIETTANTTLGQTNTGMAVDTTVNQAITLTAQSSSANSTVHAKLYAVRLLLQ